MKAGLKIVELKLNFFKMKLNRKSFFIAFVFLYFSKNVFAQIIFIRTPADSCLKECAFEEAIVRYKQTQEFKLQDHYTLFNLSCTYAKLQMRDSAFKYLETALRSDSSIRNFVDPDFYNLLPDSRWNNLQERFLVPYFKKYPLANKHVVKTFLNMAIRDQAFYDELYCIENKRGKGFETKIVWELKNLLNKQNQKELDSLVEVYGFPKLSIYGYTICKAAFMVVQHADTYYQNKFLPTFNQHLQHNEIEKPNYAIFIDRLLINQGKKQLYGSQIKTNADGSHELFPIDDPSNVDSRRKEMGMIPLKEYLSYFQVSSK